MTVIEELRKRGLVEQIIFEEDLAEKLENEKITFYLGIDPTADSLHVGHLVSINVARILQKYGKMLTKEDLDKNVAALTAQLKKLLDFEGENRAEVVNNADWTNNRTYIDFLREVGVHYNVNMMTKAECYAARLKDGLTFLELRIYACTRK